ncbi:cytochrome P450 [Pseudovirgaria hyperparasitica]|uniref:Cytochrome P450 n=1 Tax=Pseudovirgaria hyperparasitica TaxID=470096 RepID=A0A6A6W133_9PEZI|nr:cytochrome P450 [Pseudovirgaria hyperparasitica]KAF2756235.1 cytochrome P450 [Pseudovirgaria hyperparasitica]
MVFSFLDHGPAWLVVLFYAVPLWLCFTAYVIYKGYKARMPFYRLREAGMPMPPWNPILGHLLVMPEILKTMPKDSQQTDAFVILSRKFGKTDSLFYLDLWPFCDPFLIVSSPSHAIQACQEHDLIKPGSLKPFFQPLAGGDNLFTMNGPTWKSSRALFSPGFNDRYLRNQTHHIVEEALVYLEVLRSHARKQDMFSLDEATLWYTMDIIGAVTFNSRLHSQTQHNELATAMRSQISWQCLNDELNPFIRWNPIRPIMQWYNGHRMNNYISKELDQRFKEWASDDKAASTRSIMNLTIADYMREGKPSKSGETADRLDNSFKSWAATQIRLFLFAGHDSTSSSICYCYYLLQHNPGAMQKLRDEHDAVLGENLTDTPKLLCDQPDLLNKLPYTEAVIKEAMRLFPAASGMRGGRPDVSLRDNDSGQLYPTDTMNIWIVHGALQRNPKYWPRPNEFLPERWLVNSSDPLHPVKGAWRPFEHGPRNCLGQTLAMLDIKVTLALTVREFDIKEVYDEWDKINPSDGIKRLEGERAYQIMNGGSHPADGYPCRVTLRK